jgi:3-hydroxyacyl-CoA dehydrogenase
VLTGPLIGLPKSASYRLLDIVGLDVWAHVTKNLYEAGSQRSLPRAFRMPPFMIAEMIERGWLGDKRGQGFYKRVGKDREIHALDWKTFEYHPAQNRASLRSKPFAKSNRWRPPESAGGARRQGRPFLWQLLSDHVLYAAHMVPEISDRIVEIDRAMRWGYAMTLGPSNCGTRSASKRRAPHEAEGRALPESIQRCCRAGASPSIEPPMPMASRAPSISIWLR